MSNRNYVKDTNYLQIQGWMVSKLGLKGNRLLIYAIIYGFSQDGHNMFRGTMNYLAQWTCSSKESVRKILNKLCEETLIIKHIEYVNDIRFVYYKTNLEKVGGYPTKLYWQPNKVGADIQLSCDIDNIDNNIEYTEVEEELLPKATRGGITSTGKETTNLNARPQTTIRASSTSPTQPPKELNELTIEELTRLKEITLENRDTQNITYREIQKMFNLVNKVTYDTPIECNKIIKHKSKNKSTKHKTIERNTELSEEIF